MITSYHRPTKAIIHTEAITKNVANMVQQLPKDKIIFAVVKADGYGHGAAATAQAAISGGAVGLCVATIDEGIQLRQAGFDQPILVLGLIDSSILLIAMAYRLSITVATLEWFLEAEEILNQLEDHSQKLRIHIKVDTGMGRIGFLHQQDLQQAVERIKQHPLMEWEGLFTHFAMADSADQDYWLGQQQKFAAFLENFQERPKYIHSSNSAAALWHEKSIGNMIRYGVAMYGLNPSGHVLTTAEELLPAMELVSQLVQVKQVAAGTHLGYGATYMSEKEEWIGTVPIGYADGWLRDMQGFSVLVEGKYCEIVGRVCMDQIMIRLPMAYPVKTKVTLIGKNGSESISMQEVADHLQTIHYEVACTISDRVPREYKK